MFPFRKRTTAVELVRRPTPEEGNFAMAREHREQQKLNEYHFAAEAARLMGAQWELVPRNEESNGGPDFIVHEGAYRFGLEVQEVFKGKSAPKQGSELKQYQSEDQQRIDRIREKYEGVEGDIPLYVKFLDNPDDDHADQIVDKLRNINLQENGHENFVVDQDSGPLKIFVMRLPEGVGLVWQT